MKYTKIYLLLALAANCCKGYSQNQMNNWVFGDSVGLNFTTGEPVFFQTAIGSYEASASISDDFGNLVFYTNGKYVWDKNNNIMPNGDSLNIGFFYNELRGSSITQGVIYYQALLIINNIISFI